MRKLMKNKKVISIMGVAVLAVALLATGVMASPPMGAGNPPVASTINYQGQLTDSEGNPLSGSYDMEFQFWNSNTGGSQVGSTIAKNDVEVTNGLFSVKLDVDQSDFNGQGLWVQVKVGDETLSPRQQILPVPYALSLKPGARIDGSATGTQLYDAVLNVKNYNTGAGYAAIHGVSGSTVSVLPTEEVGVRGEAANGFGVLGLSSNNAGVFGYSSTSFGVWGDGNPGVYGYSTSGHGVKGESASTSGRGVEGFASATSGATVGVWGETSSSSNWADGVFGKATADSGITTGVYGWSESTQGRGVMGAAKATSGTTYGVKGESNSPDGYGVYGQNDNSGNYGYLGGIDYGVYGKHSYGNYGYLGGNNYGVQGSSQNHIGVHGYSSTNTGVYGGSTTGCGVFGYSQNARGVIGRGCTYDFYAYGPGTNYGPFTGAHEVKLSHDFPENVKPGMIVSVTGETQVRKIDGEGIGFSSTLPTVRLSPTSNDSKVLGVIISESPLPEEHWYIDESVEGERFGIVNALGDGRVWVSDINGDIAAGDYITSSAIAGYGQKQDDDLLHSYTLGKATENVDWSEVAETIEFNGHSYRAYPIAVVYTSG